MYSARQDQGKRIIYLGEHKSCKSYDVSESCGAAWLINLYLCEVENGNT